MLFVFDKADMYPFWMKNTLIPIDIIWIDSQKKVVYIFENAQPCIQEDCIGINPEVKAQYILEVPAGQASNSGIEIGSIANF